MTANSDLLIKNLVGQEVVRYPGSIRGRDMEIDNIEDCTIYILDHVSVIYINRVRNCKIFIGPISGSVLLWECRNSSLSIASRQFRTKDCSDLKLFVYCMSQPSIEHSHNMEFAPFNLAYPNQNQHFAQANLDLKQNMWCNVYDFNATGAADKNWKIMDPSEFVENKLELEGYPPAINPVTIDPDFLRKLQEKSRKEIKAAELPARMEVDMAKSAKETDIQSKGVGLAIPNIKIEKADSEATFGVDMSLKFDKTNIYIDSKYEESKFNKDRGEATFAVDRSAKIDRPNISTESKFEESKFNKDRGETKFAFDRSSKVDRPNISIDSKLEESKLNIERRDIPPPSSTRSNYEVDKLNFTSGTFRQGSFQPNSSALQVAQDERRALPFNSPKNQSQSPPKRDNQIELSASISVKEASANTNESVKQPDSTRSNKLKKVPHEGDVLEFYYHEKSGFLNDYSKITKFPVDIIQQTVSGLNQIVKPYDEYLRMLITCSIFALLSGLYLLLLIVILRFIEEWHTPAYGILVAFLLLGLVLVEVYIIIRYVKTYREAATKLNAFSDSENEAYYKQIGAKLEVSLNLVRIELASNNLNQ